MEPATHSLTAYMMSRAGLNRWCPYATPVMLLGANVPDIDFSTLLGDDLLVLQWHRGPTHALFFVAFMALLPLIPMAIFVRKKKNMRWRRAYAVSILAVLSHLALDWSNIYGVRLLEPFTSRYYHLDITGVTDVWMLAVLAGAAGWLLVSRLVSSEIGAQRSSGRGVAVAALLFVCLWQGGRYFMHERALAVLDSRIYDGAAAVRVAALPHFTSPFRWTGLVESEGAWRVIELDVLSSRFDPAAGKVFYKAEDGPAVEAARATETFRRFFRFSYYPLWQVIPMDEPEGAEKVQVMDLRFGYPGEDRFVATAEVDGDGRVLEEGFQFDPPGGGPRLR